MSFSPLEAYETVMRFARDRGQWPLRLAMHAAVAQSFRPLFLHLIKLNFLVEVVNDQSVESDVLLAPFCDEIGAGYYQFDPQVRALLLDNLQAEYSTESNPRLYSVAALLLAYVQDQERSIDSTQDRLSQSYIDVQRWIALSILDPEGAAHQLAAALNQVAPAGASAVRLQVGGLVSLLAEPLLRYPMLADYALGVQALERGEFDKARRFLAPLGDTEFEVGPVKLRPAAALLDQWESATAPREAEPVPQSATGAYPYSFISYLPGDEDFVKELKHDLSSYGVQWWSDVTHSGQRGDVSPLFEKAYYSTQVVLLVFPEHQQEDGFREDLGMAATRGKAVIALLLGTSLQDNLNHSSIKQSVDFSKWREASGRHIALALLLQALRSIEVGEPSTSKEQLQHSYEEQALALRQQGQLEEALVLLKKQEDICLELGDRNGLRLSYGNQAVILRDLGQLEEALVLLKKQEAICLELGDKDGLQTSYANQAIILRDWARLEEALVLLKKQEAICLELGDRNGLQLSYGNQAVILRDLGQLEEALVLLKKQEAICLELGDKDGLQTSYANQAIILRDWARLEEALVLLKKQEAICLELGDRNGLQLSYGNQAVILRDLGQLEEALVLLKKQEAICLELGDRNGLQLSYGNQVVILRDWRRLEEALVLLKKQEAICLELGNKYSLQRSYGDQALILQEQGQLEEALALYKKQEANCLELGAKIDLGHCYRNWGLLARTQGDRQTEKQMLEQALALFSELGISSERDKVLEELGRERAEPSNASGRVFFSYGRDDSEFVLKLAQDLKAAGANGWLDQVDISPGMRWDLAVEDALTSSLTMLVILSPVSAKSSNVLDEISFAMKRKKRIIPVVYRDCEVPLALAHLKYVDFRTDYAHGLRTLLSALRVEQQAAVRESTQEETTPGPTAGPSAEEASRRLRTLRGHSGGVSDVAVYADGRRAVSASLDKTLKVWDVDSGRVLRTLAGHNDYVAGVALSGNGRIVVSASGDGMLKVWDLESGRELYALAGHAGAVNGVAVSADGRRVVSASEDETLKMWDLETGRELHALAGHAGAVNGVAVSADGRRAVSASEDETLKVWDLETGRELRTLQGHSGSVSGVAVSANGRQAVSVSHDRTLKVWDLESGRELRSFTAHNGPVSGVALSRDGRVALSASVDNTLKLWRFAASRPLLETFTCDSGLHCCAFINDRRFIAGEANGSIDIFQLEEPSLTPPRSEVA